MIMVDRTCLRRFTAIAIAVVGVASWTSHGQATPSFGHAVFATGFIENRGQWGEAARFAARAGGSSVRLERDGLSLCALSSDRTRGAVVRLAFEGASKEIRLEPERPLPHPTHVLVGDPDAWRTHLRSWGSVLYREVWPGVDVRARLVEGRLEYDLILTAEASLDEIALRVEGAERVRLDGRAALLLDTSVGTLRQRPPVTWIENAEGRTRRVSCRYRLLAADRYGFEVDEWPAPDAARLVIDPGLEWMTVFGGSECDVVTDMVVGADGAPILVGYTGSLDFPTTRGANDETYNGGVLGCCDVFATKVAPDGQSLTFSTYLGGQKRDEGHAACLTQDGAIVLAGMTFSDDFPLTPDAVDTVRSANEGFITRLSGDGSTITYSTYLGGSESELLFALTLAPDGDPVVGGETLSLDFPTTPDAFQETVTAVKFHGFVSRLDGFGDTFVFSTYLTGTEDDLASGQAQVRRVAATSDGDIIAAGRSSTDFPATPGAFSLEPNGPFVTRLAADGRSLVWSTFVGGSKSDSLLDMVVDARDRVLLSGWTDSADFPTSVRAFQSEFIGIVSSNGFLSCLEPRGDALAFSTYFGFGNVSVSGLAVDPAGVVTFAGFVPGSGIFPTEGAFKAVKPITDGADAFVGRFDPTGDHLLYCSYFGSEGSEASTTSVVPVALAPDGRVILTAFAGSIVAPGSPTDLVVGKLDLIPTGVERYGTTTPGSAGPLFAGVTKMPKLGETSFAITASTVTPRSEGVLLISRAPLDVPLTLGGIDLWVDPLADLVALSDVSTETGWVRVDLPLLPARFDEGDVLYAQLVWTDSAAPAGRVASDALEITIQPGT